MNTVLDGNRLELFDLLEVDLLGHDLETGTPPVRCLPEPSLHRPADPDPTTLLGQLIDKLIRWVPYRDRNDVDPSSRLIAPNGDQKSDQPGTAFEGLQLGFDGDSSTEDDEVEIHDTLPFSWSGKCGQFECARPLGQIHRGRGPTGPGPSEQGGAQLVYAFEIRILLIESGQQPPSSVLVSGSERNLGRHEPAAKLARRR